MFLISNETNKFIVVQSNDLVEATYSPELTTRAHKVARFILSLISPEDKDLKLYTVPINTLKTFLGYKENTAWGNFYPEMKDIADRLNQEPIVIKSGEKLTTAYFIAGYEIDATARTITFEVSLLLKPYLLALKRNFTRYPLNYISQLRSAYSIRLYELLCQYKNIGHRTFDLASLQLLLGSNYEFYGNFKDKVLTIAKRDLAANTDIDFDYTEIKTARKVTGLRFTIHPRRTDEGAFVADDLKPVNDTPESDMPVFTADTMLALSQMGLKPTVLAKYMRKGFSIISDKKQREKAARRCNNSLEMYYCEKLELCHQTDKIGKSNSIGFFVKALQEDWQSSTHVSEETEKPKSSKNLNQNKRIEAQIQDIKRQWAVAKQAIFEIIVADTEGFNTIYEEVKEKSGTLKSTIFPHDAKPYEIFKANGMAANLLKVRMEELYSDKFKDINAAYQQKIKALEAVLSDLKLKDKL